MDGDLQHDESILPRMLLQARQDQLDIVIASRHADGASMGQFEAQRVRLSNLGLKLSRLVLHTTLSDPMSGFFLADRRFIDDSIYRTSGVGFKLLVDLLASARRPVKLAEVPYTFRLREAGQSKLDLMVGFEYLYLVLDKLTGGLIPPRFAMFTVVGAAGVVLYLATLALLYLNWHAAFQTSQIAATVLAMTANFLLNNLFTYRDARFTGEPATDRSAHILCRLYRRRGYQSERLGRPAAARPPMGFVGPGWTGHQFRLELRRHQRNHLAGEAPPASIATPPAV